MAKNVVISAKVTPDVAKAIKAQAKANGQSVSAWINDKATRVDGKALIKASKGVVVPEEVDTQITQVALQIGGSAFVGILAYKGIRLILDNAKSKGEVKYTDNEIEGISVLLGVSAAVLTGIGIHKVLSKG